MFLLDIFDLDFHFQPIVVAAIALWSLALYLAFSKLNNWMMTQLVRWLNFAERSLYTSAAEYDRTKVARENQNSFNASILTIVPFLALGSLAVYLVNGALGQTWAFSAGAVGAIGASVWELSRRTGDD
jgi:hypothetical protein